MPPSDPKSGRKPIIGITCDNSDTANTYHCPFAYCDAVAVAGGIPIALPFKSNLADIPQVVDLLDGIIFTGGNDLDPSVWGEPVHPKATPIHPDRERYERALMAEVEKRRLPTLGICLGSQLMNVYRGGSMKQFIPELGLSPTLEHRKTEGKDGRHPVSIAADSTLGKTIGATAVESNSAHKQAMANIGRGLRVIATAPDGVVEALEDPTFPLWLGVQWHPERIHTEPAQAKIFELLVKTCSEAK
jgi:putative glutamine amidotransferase